MTSDSTVMSFPSGSWTLYFHDPEDTTWTPDSYKKLGTYSDFGSLWGTLKRISAERFLSGMFFLMKDPFLPLWEHRSNKRGGSYCIKVPESVALETYQRYVASSIMEVTTRSDSNLIVGASISPKKGFHILKLWNLSCTDHNKPSDIHLYGDGMKPSDVLYRAHVEQKM